MKHLLKCLMPVSFVLLFGCVGIPAMIPGGGLPKTGGSTFPSNVPLRPPAGFIYTQVKAPLTVDAGEMKMGQRTGQSMSHYFRVPFIGIDFSWGDASYEAAKMNGSLKNISYADYEVFQVLGIYGQFKVNVYGN